MQDAIKRRFNCVSWEAIAGLKHGLAFFPVCHLLLGEGGSKDILGQTLAAGFGPTLDFDLIVDVEAGVFPGEKFFDLFPAEA